MANDKCFLCSRLCTTESSENFDVYFFQCPSCGNYGLDRKTKVNFERNSFERERASHLAAECHIHGKPLFVLTETDDTSISFQGETYTCVSMETFLRGYPKDAIEILDRTLQNLARLATFPGESIRLNGEPKGHSELSVAFTNNWHQQTDVFFLLELERVIAIQMTPIKPDDREICGVDRENNLQQFSFLVMRIQPEGWRRIRELKSKAAGDHPQAFVAMWFDPSRKKYFDYIRKAAEESGFEKCLRIDDKETNDKICDEIIAEIRKSQCLIADFTGNRGGVYFEAGFALGLGIPVIWLVDANWLKEKDEHGKQNELHFDTRQYAHIVYENEDELYTKLKNRLAATVPIRK